MPLTITYAWICDLCGGEFAQPTVQTLHDAGSMIQRWWTVPGGWRWIDGKLVCDKHKIVVDPVEASAEDMAKIVAAPDGNVMVLDDDRCRPMCPKCCGYHTRYVEASSRFVCSNCDIFFTLHPCQSFEMKSPAQHNLCVCGHPRRTHSPVPSG